MQAYEAYNEGVRRMSRLVDDLYKENDALKEGNQFLRERCEQLEQLVKLQHAVIVQIVKIQHDNELLADFMEEGRGEDAEQYFEFDEEAFRRDLKAAQAQYKALLEQEAK